MTAMTNAQRQAAWRARRRAAVTVELVQVGAVAVTHDLSDEAVQRDWVARLAAGKLSPYQQHCFKVRYGCELFRATVQLAAGVTASSSDYWSSRVTVFFAAGVYRRPLFATADLYKFSMMPRTWAYRERGV